MKTARTFKGSWFLFAIVVAILLGEVAAQELARYFGFQNNPFLVAFICIGVVTAAVSVIYKDADFD